MEVQNITVAVNVTNVNMPSLRNVTGSIKFQDNEKLETLHFPSLRSVGGLIATSSMPCNAIDLDVQNLLVVQGDLIITYALRSCPTYPALERIGGGYEMVVIPNLFPCAFHHSTAMSCFLGFLRGDRGFSAADIS